MAKNRLKFATLFNASFEESLNIEDDAFLKLQMDQHYKTAKHFKNGKPSLYFIVKSLLFALIFTFGTNMFFLGLSIMFNDSTTLKVPISKPPLLTPAVSMIILICWLSLVLIGKFIKQAHILPYRYQFHAFTTMIACIASFDLLFTALLLPAFSVWGVLALYGTFVITGHFIHSVAVDRLIKRLYNPAISLKSSDMLLSKIAICLCVLGAGLSLFLKGYTIDSPTSDSFCQG